MCTLGLIPGIHYLWLSFHSHWLVGSSTSRKSLYPLINMVIHLLVLNLSVEMWCFQQNSSCFQKVHPGAQLASLFTGPQPTQLFPVGISQEQLVYWRCTLPVLPPSLSWRETLGGRWQPWPLLWSWEPWEMSMKVAGRTLWWWKAEESFGINSVSWSPTRLQLLRRLGGSGKTLSRTGWMMLASRSYNNCN